MSWYRLVITREEAFAGLFDQVRETLSHLHIASGAPIGVFMYSVKREPSPKSTYYFPPSAVTIAQSQLHQFGAVKCEAPDHSVLQIEYSRDA